MAYGGWVSSWIWWLDNNLRHAIHKPTTGYTGHREARTALTLLSHAAHSLNDWLTLLPAS